MTKPKLVFDPFSQEYFDNPYEIYRRMRDEAPVYYSEEYDFYALTRHEDVAPAFKDFETYSSSRGATWTRCAPAKYPQKSIIWMDPPDHRHMRSLLNKVFTPRAIQSQRETVRDDRPLPPQGRPGWLRCRAGLLRPVPGRGHHPDGRSTRRRPPAGPALDRNEAATRARSDRLDRAEHASQHRHRHVLQRPVSSAARTRRTT